MQNSKSNINLHSIAHQALLNYGFVPEFPSGAVKDTQKLKDQLEAGHLEKSIEDLRDLLWSSIDNIDSEDLDQLEYCERAPRQEIHVFVAIADVDAYVKKGAAIDRHAHQNGTSVYAEVEVFPMLPNKLCTDLSSLCEGKDRLAVVVDFFVKKNGETRPGRIRRAMVNNKAKLVYEPIGDWLENKELIPDELAQNAVLKEQILLQYEAAGRLHESRMNNGALELETIETSVVMEDGKISEIAVRKKNLARLIIENFMITANRNMTAFLEKNKYSYIQRILRTPERWPRIVEIALSLNDELPDEADSKALGDFLARQRKRDPDHFPDLSLAVVKLLGHAEYDLVEAGRRQLGHFGLAVHDYTHSTAPNRRYVDIVIQRLVKSILEKKHSPYTKRELKSVADWCTDRDHSSKKVERFMVKVAGAILLMGRVGEIFSGIVTGASSKGVYVRLFSPPVEGRVMRKFNGMNVGDKVRVRLMALDPTNGYVDFEGMNHSNGGQ